MNMKFETLLTPEIVSGAAEVLGDSGTKEMMEEVLAYTKKVEAAKAAMPTSSKKGVKKKVWALKSKDILEEAQKYKPPGEGVVLTQETQWHARWKITYPQRSTPPFSHGAPFDSLCDASCKEALQVVLKWAWDSHEKATGDVCPFIFD